MARDRLDPSASPSLAAEFEKVSPRIAFLLQSLKGECWAHPGASWPREVAGLMLAAASSMELSESLAPLKHPVNVHLTDANHFLLALPCQPTLPCHPADGGA